MSLKLDPAAFFKALKGTETAKQREGFLTLLGAFHKHGDGDPRKLAYVFATAWWETDKKMQPIDEYGKGKGKPYGKPTKTGQTYYGRGFVQLTWERNYIVAGKALGFDLQNQPELAKVLEVAADIAVVGMYKGWFTGKKLGDYFNSKVTDPWNARRIINGTDKAAEIASIYNQMLVAIFAALPASPAVATLAALPPEPPADPLHKSKINQLAGGAAVLGGAVPVVQNVAQIANTATEQVQTVAENVNGVMETATQTVTVVKENHDTVTGVVGWLLNPWVGVGFGVLVILLVLGIWFYRSRLKETYGV